MFCFSWRVEKKSGCVRLLKGICFRGSALEKGGVGHGEVGWVGVWGEGGGENLGK